MKKFKSRNKNKNKILNYIIILLFIITFICIKSDKKEELFLTKLYHSYENSRIKDIDFMLDYTLGLKYKEKEEEVKVIKYEKKPEKEESPPIVYIYNTHQTEEYKSSFLETYNIPSTVLIASKMLKEKLEDFNVNSIVEDNDLVKIRNNMGLKYGRSYQISRMSLEEAKNENDSLQYFIDIHRDSGKHTLNINNILKDSYAKVLFVIGLDNPTFEENLKFAEALDTSMNNKVKGISRGIVKKSGKGVNGIYNQDFNKNTILIEIGGENNEINEVYNTIDILGEVLAEYIRGDSVGF